MFMVHNRAVNGAKAPGSTQSASVKKLSPNFAISEQAEDWRFMPSMSTPEAINRGHYEGGISGDGPFSTSYEQHIPFVGSEQDRGTQTLKG